MTQPPIELKVFLRVVAAITLLRAVETAAADSVKIDEVPPPIRPGEARVVDPGALPPKLEDYAEKLRRQNLKMMLGNVPVYRGPEGSFKAMLAMATSSDAPSDCAKHSFQPVPVAALGLAGARVARTDWDSPSRCSDGRASRVTRIIAAPGDKIISLTEWDFGADGGGIMQSSSAVNTSLHGVPAVLMGSSSDSGASCWRMTWQSSIISYEMTMCEPLFRADAPQEMLDMGSGVAAAMPR
jgi:hypothetical protein